MRRIRSLPCPRREKGEPAWAARRSISAAAGSRHCHIRAALVAHTSNQEDQMNQSEKAMHFAELHIKGAPLLLYNAWDAGSAKSILDAGAKAIATSSWAVAEAQGYRDGEAIPIEFAEQIVARIAATIDVPVTVVFEGGYSEDDGELAA